MGDRGKVQQLAVDAIYSWGNAAKGKAGQHRTG
jgi:hypothetical protein